MRGILVRAIGVCLLFSAGSPALASPITYTDLNPQAAPLVVPPFQAAAMLVARVTQAVLLAFGEKARGQSFKLAVVDMPTVNAWVTEDGTIVVFTGLLHELSYDPEALAFVLAHELTHRLSNHVEKGAARQSNILAWSAMVSAIFHFNSDSFKAAMAVGEFVAGWPYERKLENEADAGAVDIIFKMGISPEGAIRFFESIESSKRSHLQQNMRAMFHDHPADHDRVSRIRARYETLRFGGR